MDIDRRTFLKLVGVGAGTALLPCGAVWAAPPQGDSNTKPRAMLSDLTRCVGCGWCQQACKDWNRLPGRPRCPGEGAAVLSADDWTLADYREIERDGNVYRVFVKRQCMHCLSPACVSACPVGALQKQATGAVTYDPTRCIGCRYCMVACPFGVPKFQWNESLPMICKCTFCADRQAQGLEPACSGACPTGALTFGDREALIAEAKARIQANAGDYRNHVYGENELGGTSWLYLSPVPFAELGFPTLKTEPVTRLSETVATYGSSGMGLAVAVLLGGVHHWVERQRPEAEAEAVSVEEIARAGQ